MNKLFGIALLMLAVSTLYAHPGVGILPDSRGNVFYTDLAQVWKIAPSGAKTVAVPSVHTHELYIDADDNLFGEHLWNEGDRWRHRVWRLSPDGSLSEVVPARDGFLSDDSLVRDRAGNHYWADRGEKIVIKRRTANGQITTHASADFRDVSWITSAPSGTLYLIDRGELRRISTEGTVSTLVAKLSSHSPPPSAVTEKNYHMGLWTDSAENVFVAVGREQLVLRIDHAGKVSIAARSPGTWSPSGGMFDHDGNLWLLEYSPTNTVRVRRIDQQGNEQTY
jgi:hypothetical protein